MTTTSLNALAFAPAYEQARALTTRELTAGLLLAWGCKASTSTPQPSMR